MIPVEIIIIGHEALDGVELNHHVLELACKEETTGHALAAGDGVTLGRARADDFEQLLRDPDVFTWIAVLIALAHQSHNCCFQDVLPWVGGFKIFYKVLCFNNFVIV